MAASEHGADKLYPERQQVEKRELQIQHSMKRAGLRVAGIAAASAALWLLSRRRSTH
jgi:hypothetical protein